MPKNEANYNGKRREDWETPQWLFDKLNDVFDFYIDLAANEENKKCHRFISEENDFLSLSGFSHLKDKWAWCNPPYGRNGCGKWIRKIFEVPNSVTLLPASVGAKWFSPVWDEAEVICFLYDRLTFVGAPHVAQFDSCLVLRTINVYNELTEKTVNGYKMADIAQMFCSIGNVVTSEGMLPRIKQERVEYF